VQETQRGAGAKPGVAGDDAGVAGAGPGVTCDDVGGAGDDPAAVDGVLGVTGCASLGASNGAGACEAAATAMHDQPGSGRRGHLPSSSTTICSTGGV